MLEAFYLLVFQQILQGLYSLWAAFDWLRFVRARLSSHSGFYAPRVALICPCKGLEPGLEENLTAMTHFDYADYEVFFALSDGQDPARNVIDRVAAKSERPVHVVIAGRPKQCSEKVNNLLAAVEQAGENFEVFVFTDSDVHVGRRWLGRLVAPLGDPRRGASTTFRWYIPVQREMGGFFWSALAAAWNAAAASMLGGHNHNFCWGGGTAIRRQTFEEIHAQEYWRGAASDDLALTRALERAGKSIYFVPECLSPTPHATNFHCLLEFTNRQMVITRVYRPNLWALALVVHLSYCATVLYALGVVLTQAFTGDQWFSLALILLVIPLLAALKGAMRLVAVLDVLPEWRETMVGWNWAWSLLAPLVPFLYLWNTLVAAFTRRIRWRGLHYELVSPNQTRILPR